MALYGPPFVSLFHSHPIPMGMGMGMGIPIPIATLEIRVSNCYINYKEILLIINKMDVRLRFMKYYKKALHFKEQYPD